MNANDLQIIKTAFDNYRVTKKVNFPNLYIVIFGILKNNKNIDPLITLLEDFISANVNVYNFATLESFVSLWKETIFYCDFLCVMTPYYQDILTTTNSKYKKTTIYTTKLLHDKYNDIKNGFCTLLINMLISEYQRTPVDRSLVKKCLDIVRETKTLDYFNQQYKSACTTWLVKGDYTLPTAVSTYVYVADCAEQYDIADTTIPILKDTVCIPTVATYAPTVDKMLEFSDSNLSNYYKLVKYLEQTLEFGKTISQHIIANCPCTTVEKAIEHNNKYMKILDGLEPGRFEKKGISGFFYCGFQNVYANFSETLALFMDSCFQKKLSEDEFEALINECVALANYIKDRDVFFAYYKKLFARRLLTAKKIALERIVLTSLKKQFSSANTHHLERMFKDVEAADDVNQEFKQSNNVSPMNVTVLSQGCWPNFSLGRVPACMQSHFEEFQKFYKTKYGNRNLKILSVGTCEIKMGRFILHTNVAQMNVLLALNETDEIDKICQLTQFDSDTVEGILASLTLPKHPVVVRSSVSSDSEPRNVKYVMNPAFKSKTVMVKISPPVKKETVVEQKATMTQIENERCLKIDAAVVRLLKARKKIDYNNIIIETTKSLQAYFTPNPHMIKRRIESLIEREFMKRDDEDCKMFVYLA